MSTDSGDWHVPGEGSANPLGLVHFCGFRPPRAPVDALQAFGAREVFRQAQAAHRLGRTLLEVEAFPRAEVAVNEAFEVFRD